MLNVSSKGFTFNDEKGGANPGDDLQMLLSGACTSYNSFENALQSPLAASLHDVSAMCRDLQAANITLLKQALLSDGIEPEETQGFWNSLTGLLSSTAAILGEDALLTAFRKHELDLFSDYESKISSFDGDRLALMQQQLIPNQLRVCELLGASLHGEDDTMAKASIPMDFNLA